VHHVHFVEDEVAPHSDKQHAVRIRYARLCIRGQPSTRGLARPQGCQGHANSQWPMLACLRLRFDIVGVI
jgi:hypothetical protein